MADTMTGTEKRQFAGCYITFMLNGALALSIGALLPYIRESAGLEYAFAGLLVSLHSVGNLCAAFAAGALPLVLGRRKSFLVFSSCYALSFLLMLMGSSKPVLALAFFLTGLTRGAVSNFNNIIINDIAPGKAWALNVLHACFAVGAFTSPLLVMLCAGAFGNWRLMYLILIAFGVAEWLLYLTIPIPQAPVKTKRAGGNLGFLRHSEFWFTTATLFCYLCAEQGVIGWMVTYYKDTGILPASYAQITASLLWVLILAGRLTAAWLSTRMDKSILLVLMGVGLVGFFYLMLSAKSLPLVLISIAGFGFSMAGIYPTTVSLSSTIMKAYPLCWSFILTIASFGSIIMPSIIGAVAEQGGIAMGMHTITAAVLITLGCLLANLAVARRKAHFVAKAAQQ